MCRSDRDGGALNGDGGASDRQVQLVPCKASLVVQNRVVNSHHRQCKGLTRDKSVVVVVVLVWTLGKDTV